MKTECTSRLAFLNPPLLVGFALYAAGLILALAPVSNAAAGDRVAAELSQSPPPQPSGRWRVTGDLGTARFSHTATLLPNRQVLVAGGFSDDPFGYLASAELYDPATGMWTDTGSMATGRYSHTATLLPNGQVLAAGGNSPGSAEVYDPPIGSWTATNRLKPARSRHTATLLGNSNVLVSGGAWGLGILARAQLYKSAPEVVEVQEPGIGQR